MTVTLHLPEDLEKKLAERAKDRGLSLGDYLQEVVASDVRKSATSQFRNLSDLLASSPLFGADLDLNRLEDPPRSIDLDEWLSH